MQAQTTRDYEKLIKEMDIQPETAQKALAVSVETALRHFYKVWDCQVDVETLTANIVFLMPQHRHIIERFCDHPDVLEHDILPVTFDLAALPDTIHRIVRPLFVETLKRMKAEDDFAVWKRRVRSILQGVVQNRCADYVEVNLNGVTAILPKNAWAMPEASQYYRGNLLFFYVASVKRLKGGASVMVSRSAIKLPALLLRTHLPAHHFVCVRRFPGQKSILFTDAAVRDKNVCLARDCVQNELNGEILELRPIPAMAC